MKTWPTSKPTRSCWNCRPRKAGVLVRTTVAVGDTVTSQQVIGKIDTAASRHRSCAPVAAEAGVPATRLALPAVAPPLMAKPWPCRPPETGR